MNHKHHLDRLMSDFQSSSPHTHNENAPVLSCLSQSLLAICSLICALFWDVTWRRLVAVTDVSGRSIGLIFRFKDCPILENGVNRLSRKVDK